MKIIRLALGLSVAFSSLAAIETLAANPVAYINSASGLTVGMEAALKGGNFPGNSTITLTITTPKGAELSDQVVTNADGKLIARLPLDEEGRYTVQAEDPVAQVAAHTYVFAGPTRP